MAKKQKFGDKQFIFLEIQVRTGEQEFSCNSVHELDGMANIGNFADQYSEDFYGNKASKDGDWHEHVGGTILSRPKTIQIITDKEYNVLKKFL